LIGGASKADSSGAHGEARGADASLAEGYFILSGEFFGERLDGGQRGGGVRGEPGGPEAFGGAAKEVSP
jgi:hypothetical protein